MFVKLEGRDCLVVGAGAIAQGKIEGLLQSGAVVRVVAPEATEEIRSWATSGTITWQQKNFIPSDLDRVFLVITATSSQEVNADVFENARARNILCNSVDDPEHCDFYYPAVVRRGKLQLAISTAGNSPALAQKLRRDLEAQYGPEYEAWLEELGAVRDQLFASDMDPELRRQKLHELAKEKPVNPITKEASHAR